MRHSIVIKVKIFTEAYDVNVGCQPTFVNDMNEVQIVNIEVEINRWWTLIQQSIIESFFVCWLIVM